LHWHGLYANSWSLILRFEPILKRRTDMLDFIKKSMLTGIGIAMKTKDELEEWVKEIVKKGEMSENEGQSFLDDIKRKSKEAQKDLEEKIESKFKELLKKADIATRDEVSELKNEIEELKKTVTK
jgi:polyhydroxyalkanoate synthesis regulator phasin